MMIWFRVLLAGLPLLFGYVASILLGSVEFSEFYTVVSYSIILTAFFKFGAELELKRRFLNGIDNAGTTIEVLGRGFTLIPIFIVCLLAFIVFGFENFILFWAFFIQHLLLSIYSLERRYRGGRWGSLILETPVLFFFLLVGLIGSRFIGGDVGYFLLVSCFMIFIYQILCTYGIWFENIRITPALSKRLDFNRVREGGLAITGILSIWLLMAYFARDVTNAKSNIMAFQLSLIMSALRSIELNWNYMRLMKVVSLIVSVRSGFWRLLLTRALLSLVISSVILLGVILSKYTGFELVYNLDTLIVFLVIEVVYFSLSPFVAFEQASESGGRVNLMISLSLLPVIFLCVAGGPIEAVLSASFLGVFMRIVLVRRSFSKWIA